MKILKNAGTFEVLTKPENVIGDIAAAARTCYQSQDKASPENDIKLVKNLITRGHTPMLEFSDITVRFNGVSRGFCYDDATEVLTDGGWKYFKDTTNKDNFATINMRTFKVEYQKRIDYVEEEWNAPLIYGKSTQVDFAVTPNHRMLYFHYDSRIDRKWKIDSADSIYNKRVKFKRAFPSWEGKKILLSLERFDINSVWFAKFIGLYVTDGSSCKSKDSGGRVTISQTKESGKKYIEEVLNNLAVEIKYDDHEYRINNTKLYHFLKKHFVSESTKSYNGKFPKWLLEAPVKYLRAFIEAAIVGDGNIHRVNGHRVIYSSNKDYADGFQEILSKIGISSSIRVDNRVGDKRFLNGTIIENKVVGYIVSINDKTDEHLFNKKLWSRKLYKGKVYCVTVPNGTLYVRRNGKPMWSGNTHEMVRHRLASYAQESTRYVDEKDFEFIVPPHRDENECIISLDDIAKLPYIHGNTPNNNFSFYTCLDIIGKMYRKFRDIGWKPEDVRQILPTAIQAQIVVKANIAEWRHIFFRRCDKFAHWEIRVVMIELLKWCQNNIPVVFDDFKFFKTNEGLEYATMVLSSTQLAEKIIYYTDIFDFKDVVCKLDEATRNELLKALNSPE